VDEVIRVVVRLAQLLQDDSALDLDVVRLERRRQDDISQQVRGFREAGVERVGVETGVLLGGEGVDVPPSRSIARAISTVERRRVRLKRTCSRKCEIPRFAALSSPEPARTKKPSAKDRTSCISSMRTVTPFSRRCFWTIGTPGRRAHFIPLGRVRDFSFKC